MHKIIVIKWGGAAMQNAANLAPMVANIAAFYSQGILPVIVHGGGPEITRFCERLQLPVQFVQGQRYTDAETLEVVQMILFGKTNRTLVTAFNQHHMKAVGLTGQDTAFLQAKPWRNPDGSDLGYVGEITQVNTDLLHLLLSKQFIPVIAPIAVDSKGQAYNINADLAAGAIAGALQAEKLLVFTDVNGLYADVKDPASRIPAVKAAEIESWLKAGKITGGMVPKLLACTAAVNQGVRSAHILEGKMAERSFSELLQDKAFGTTITA